MAQKNTPAKPQVNIESDEDLELRDEQAHVDSSAVEDATDAAASSEDARTESASTMHKAGANARQSLGKLAKNIRNWFERVAPGHGNAILFGVLGLVAALLLFSVGFWRMLVLVLFIGVGICFGQYLDGDPKLFNAIKGFFGRK